jgi:hypothetical protein
MRTSHIFEVRNSAISPIPYSSAAYDWCRDCTNRRCDAPGNSGGGNLKRAKVFRELSYGATQTNTGEMRPEHGVSKNGADIPESHQMFGHGPEDLRTTKDNGLDFERSTVNQTLAPFISHDIRHHLASIYCNIEFRSDPGICQTDREQLLAEVRGTIHDMTDLLDSCWICRWQVALGRAGL